MIVNELKFTLRKLIRQKVFPVINLIGLTIGITFAILAFTYGEYEFGFDKQFTNTENTFLLACNNGRNKVLHYGQPGVFKDQIIQDIPEVTQGVRMQWNDENVKIAQSRFKAIDFVYTDSSFFPFMGWDLIVGDPTMALCVPFSVTISEKIAKQYFPDGNMLGQVVNLGNAYDFKVTGVFKNFPEQTQFQTDFIASLSTYRIIAPHYFTEWGWHSSGVYLKLQPSADVNQVKLKIAKLWNDKSEDLSCTGPHIRAELVPFSEVYLRSGKYLGVISAIDYVVVFGLIAVFILLISCFNFVNLSIAIQSKRTIETGIKKVLGARAILFLRQIVLEILVYLAIALVFSYAIVQLVLPGINSVLNKHLAINLVSNYTIWLFIAGLFASLLIICGSIPFYILWKSNTTGLLKGVTLFRRKSVVAVAAQSTFKHSLVIAQFAIGILLVIATLVVNKQMRLIRQHNTGFDKEQLIYINNQEGDQLARYQSLHQIASRYPEIKDITCGSGVPFNGINNWGGPKVLGEDEKNMQGCGFISVDANYLSTIGAQFIDGRNFKEESSTDRDKIIISESLVKALQLDHPVGTLLEWLWSNEPREVIGVVKDIEYHSIREQSYPVVYFCQRTDVIGYTQQILVKLQSDNLPDVIERLKKDWNEISPEYPMDCAFLDQRFDENYRSEHQTSLFLNIMAVVAIILCSLGLFGLAVFHINARIKEIGIRKVNGAKITEILALLNKDFVIWVLIAFLIASPLAYVIIKKWLENFAVKTQLSWWLFIASGIIALLIALITVSVQTWRAASRNPVEALRYE